MDPLPSPVAPRCRARRLALFASLAILGCTESPPVQLEVVARLLQPEGPAGFGEQRECAVGHEYRPATGCPDLVQLRPREPEEGPTRGYAVFPPGYGRDLLVEISTRPDALTKWTPKAWHEIPSAGRQITLEVPETSGRIRALAFAFHEVDRTLRADPIIPPVGSVLQGGVALDPVVPADRSAPVEFRIQAHPSDGEPQTLFSTTIDPAAAAPGWTDYTLSLDSFAGREVTLEFRTRWSGGVTAAIAAPLWSRPAVLAPTADPDWNFVLVSLDTLRADHVGVYGAGDGVTPNLDALAASGVTFEHASTTFPSTTASHMSLFTGLYPSVHEVRAPPASLAPKIPTLAQLLASSGYRTAAVTENGMIVARAGFMRGFDSYAEFKDATPAAASGHIDKVLDVATRWLADHRDEQFLLFVHTYQVHGPHNPPAEFDRFEPLPGRNEAVAEMHAAYRGEILYADHEIQRLVGALDSLGLAKRTVLIVTSDHGEGFGEQQVFGHGHNLTEELLHIPMIVRAPGLGSPSSRVGRPVSLVDVSPTILELAGVRVPAGVQGRSFADTLSGKGDDSWGPVYSEVPKKTGNAVAIREGDTKWIFRPGLESPQVFDLSSGTEAEIEPVPPHVRARGRALYDRFEGGVRESRRRLANPGSGSIEVDAETEQQLRVLGYVD